MRDARLFVLQYYLSEYREDVGPGTFDLSTAMTAEEMMQAMVVEKTEEEDGEGDSAGSGSSLGQEDSSSESGPPAGGGAPGGEDGTEDAARDGMTGDGVTEDTEGLGGEPGTE